MSVYLDCLTFPPVHVPKEILQVIIDYWGIGSLYMFDRMDDDPDYPPAMRIEWWLRMLSSSLSSSTDVKYVESHIEYYQKHLNYHIEVNSTLCLFLIRAMIINQSKLAEKIIQLHLKDYSFPCNHDDPDWVSKLFQDQALMPLLGPDFIKEMMDNVPDVNFFDKVLSHLSPVILQIFPAVLLRAPRGGLQRVQMLEPHITTISSWKSLARGICHLDASDEKEKLIFFCQQRLTTEFATVFQGLNCYAPICRTNDVKFASVAIPWTELTDYRRDCLLRAAFNRLHQDAFYRRKTEHEMLKFLLKEKKIDRFVSQKVCLNFSLIEFMQRHKIGQTVLQKSKFHVNQLKYSFDHSFQTLEFYFNIVKEDQMQHDPGVVKMISRITSEHNYCRHKYRKRKYHEILVQNGQSVSGCKCIC